MWKKRNLLSLGLAAALAVVSLPVFGARVTLKNGETLEGQIISQSDNRVTIQTLQHTLTIPRSRISGIIEGEPWSVQVYQAEQALRRGDLQAAKRLCAEARSKGAPEETVDQILEKVRAQEAERQLARYQETLDEAREVFKAGNEEEALAILESLLREVSENDEQGARREIIRIMVDYHVQFAKEFSDRVQYERAVEELNKVIELEPGRAEAYVDLGDIYAMSSGAWPLAIRNYQKALELAEEDLSAPEQARIHWQLGEIHRQSSDWRNAAIHYRRAYQIDPEVNLRVEERLIQACSEYAKDIRESKPKAALQVAEEGLKVRKDEDLMEMKGEILRDMERYEDSNQAFRELLEMVERPRRIYYQMALNHFAQGEILAGRELLKKEVSVNPRNYDALCLLGEYALQRDDYSSAQEYYHQAREIDVDRPKAFLGLAKAYRHRARQFEEEARKMEALERARGYVDEVLARLPKDREANLEKGRILRDEEDYEEASEYFTTVLELIEEADPEEQDELTELKADALIARGEIKLLTAGPGTANKDFLAALEAKPNYGQAYYAIGRAYRKKFQASKNQEDLKTAEENLLKAIELEPQNAQFALELGILYQQELAQVDTENEDEYLENAANFYERYINLGGANAPEVRQWIREIRG